MIKEHDKQAQTKETPKKLTYGNSKEEGSRSSKKRGLSKRSSNGSSGTTRTRSKARSSGKIQRSLSHIKTSSQLRRYERLGNRSKSKTKARGGRAKSRSRRSGEGGTSLDFDYEDGLKDTCKDLSTPYKRPKSTAFPSRITRFKYHRRAKLLRNIKVYKGSKDLEDHLGIFSAAVEQEEWPMAIWCKMFCQTLSGAARNWFHDLDPKMDEMFEKVRAFIRGEVAAVSVEIEHGCVRLDAGSGYGCASVRHGAPVENIPLSKTNSLEEAVPKSRPKKGAKGESDGTWQVLTVFTSLNKVCPKVHVVILDVKGKGWDPLKGFGNMFSHGPLRKNSGATYQRMMDKVLTKQKGRNVEVYLEDMVIKSRSKQDLIQGVEETLYKLQRVNMKLDPNECTFEIEERMEICYTLTEKTVMTLVHTAICHKKIFRTYKLNVITNDPMEQILKNPEASGRLALWAIKLKTYHISYLTKEKAERQVVEKFLVKNEQVSKVPENDDDEASGTREGPLEELVPDPRA
ncbi:hypothetical protein Tco_0698669 [Tanacetum coccineum]